MTEQIPQPESNLPEQLISSQKVGHILAGELPWLDGLDPTTKVDVSEMVFQDGTIYVASAMPPKLREIAAVARSQDPKLGEGEHYSRSDMMFITAAHLEATGQAQQSQRVGYVTGDISEDYSGVLVKAYKEGPRPNARRLYYGTQRADLIGFTQTAETSTPVAGDSTVLIRLALTDKKYQIPTLKVLTSESRATLRKHKVGSS